MDKKGLPASLWQFSKTIEEKVNEYKTNGQLTKIKRPFLKAKVDSFEYKEGGLSYQMSQIPLEKEEWDIRIYFDFIEKVINKIPAHSLIVSAISKKYEVNENQAAFWLQRFIQTLTGQIFEGLSDENLVNTISTFVNDLEKCPLEWQLKIWINGLWLRDQEYNIHEKFKIRRTTSSDLEIERSLDSLIYSIPNLGNESLSSAVIELTYRDSQNKNYYYEIDNIMNCLRLFKLGSVYSIKTEALPKSILTFGMSSSSGPGQYAQNYKYSLGSNDILKMKEFITKIKGLLPENILNSTAKTDSIGIALQRYNDALLKPDSAESRITSSITCLESLFLKSEERVELSHRLGQRAGALLGFVNLKPLEVYTNLIRAYDIRSTFIHGSLIEEEKRKDINQLAEKILDYARICLIVFLQLKNLVEKDALINKIDNAILDANAHLKLEELIKEHCILALDFD